VDGFVVVAKDFSAMAMAFGWSGGIVAVDIVTVAVAVKVVVVAVGVVAVFHHESGNLGRTYRCEGGKGHNDKGKEEGLGGEHHGGIVIVIALMRQFFSSLECYCRILPSSADSVSSPFFFVVIARKSVAYTRTKERKTKDEKLSAF
jgi:hypothetical protein